MCRSSNPSLLAAIDAALSNVRSIPDLLDQYSYLLSLQSSDPNVFTALLQLHPAEILPIVYTPGVGDACLNWGTLKTRGSGLVLSSSQRGSFETQMRAWGGSDIKAIVVTDGVRQSC